MAEDSPDDSTAVLVVEDETLVRVVLTEMLGGGGFQVYDARDGQEALTILEVRGDAIRVLVTDIAMPNLNGLDLAEIVTRRWPHIGIILSSVTRPRMSGTKCLGELRSWASPTRKTIYSRPCEP